MQRRLEVFSAYTHTLEYRKGTANGNADFLSRLSQPANDADRTGPNHLTSPDTVGISLIRPCEPSMPDIGLGGLVPTPSLPIPVIRPIPFTDDDYGDFRRLGPSMGSSGPSSAPKTFVGPISTHDNAAGSLARPANGAVDAGAFPGLAFRPPLVSPPPTIGATTPAPTDLISSRTSHRVAAAGIPRATVDYGFGRRVTAAAPPKSAPSRPRAPAPTARGLPRLSEPTTLQAVPPA